MLHAQKNAIRTIRYLMHTCSGDKMPLLKQLLKDTESGHLPICYDIITKVETELKLEEFITYYITTYKSLDDYLNQTTQAYDNSTDDLLKPLEDGLWLRYNI